MRPGRIIICALLAGLLVSCSTPQSPDTLENRLPDERAQLDPGDEGGLGGTGMLARGSGLGGTGIIGTVTGFGSVFVNGEEVEFDASTKLFLDGDTVTAYQFSRGDMVAIRTGVRERESVASEIYIRHEVIGPVQRVLPDTRHIIVLGQRVYVGSLSLPQPGQTVRISGFRDNRDVIHANRISPAVDSRILLVGEMRREASGWRIGQQRLRFPADSRLHEGQSLRIRGILRDGVLEVTQKQTLATLPFQQPVSRLLLQGFVRHIEGSQYRIANQTFIVAARTLQRKLLQQSDNLLRLELRYTADRLDKGRWQMSYLLDSRLLPMGQPLPVRKTGQPLPQRPNRPIMPSRPRSVPGGFMR